MFVFFWCLFLIEFGGASADNVVAGDSGGEESEDEWNYIGTDQKKGQDKDKKVVKEQREQLEANHQQIVEIIQEESQELIQELAEGENVSIFYF